MPIKADDSEEKLDKEILLKKMSPEEKEIRQKLDKLKNIKEYNRSILINRLGEC